MPALAPPCRAEEAAKPAATTEAEAPLDKPNMKKEDFLSWVGASASDVMTFGYTDYAQRLQAANQYFTKGGWGSFESYMQSAHTTAAISAQHQVLTARAADKPVVEQEGVIGGAYQWTVTVPLAVTYKSPDEEHTDTLDLHLVVERVAKSVSPSGLAFAQWSVYAK